MYLASALCFLVMQAAAPTTSDFPARVEEFVSNLEFQYDLAGDIKYFQDHSDESKQYIKKNLIQGNQTNALILAGLIKDSSQIEKINQLKSNGGDLDDAWYFA